jgi:hypothetical protein
VKIEYTLPFRRQPDSRITLLQPPAPLPNRAPRIARLVALAHKLDELVRSGAVKDYGELARLGRISPARLTQIMVLLHLSPAIQEQLLFLPAAEARFLRETELRRIAREAYWPRQSEIFEQLRSVSPHSSRPQASR